MNYTKKIEVDYLARVEGQGLSVLKKCRGGEPKLIAVGPRDDEELQPYYRPLWRSKER